MAGMELGALERDLLEYQFSEDDDGEVYGNILLMTPSSFMSPTKEAPASLSLVNPISLAMDNRSRSLQKLLHESPRRRRFEETMMVSFLNTLKKSEYEANNDSKSKEQELEMMEALQVLISRDNSAIAWAKHKDALCFVRFVVDRIPTPVLGECIKPFGKGDLSVNETF